MRIGARQSASESGRRAGGQRLCSGRSSLVACSLPPPALPLASVTLPDRSAHSGAAARFASSSPRPAGPSSGSSAPQGPLPPRIAPPPFSSAFSPPPAFFLGFSASASLPNNFAPSSEGPGLLSPAPPLARFGPRGGRRPTPRAPLGLPGTSSPLSPAQPEPRPRLAASGALAAGVFGRAVCSERAFSSGLVVGAAPSGRPSGPITWSPH